VPFIAEVCSENSKSRENASFDGFWSHSQLRNCLENAKSKEKASFELGGN
jgi:hypothetical protein